MELTFGPGFAFVSCLYLSIFTTALSAKCSGSWAIHACLGGNGKRSDPSINPQSSLPPSLLHRLLISDAQRLSRMLQEAESAPAEAELLLPRSPYDVDPAEEDAYEQQSMSAPDVRDLRRYLRALKLQHALRERDMDLI